MRLRWRWLNLALILGPLVGCDNAAGPSAPAPVATATPAPPIPIVVVQLPPSGSATPSPRVKPCANGNMPVHAVTIQLHSVRTESGELRPVTDDKFWVGETLRFDATGWDVYTRPTNGCDDDGPRWTWTPREIVEWNGPVQGWMPSATSIAPGFFQVTADFDGVSWSAGLTFLSSR